MKSNQEGSFKGGLTLELSALLLICAAYIVFLLSVPLFPTQDGPMHLYNVHIMGKLLTHASPAYANFYDIKHILPPYSLYYYALLLLSKVFPVLLADRLIVCLYVLLFVFGFRYLARSIGQSADLMTLLVSTLLLSWPLAMGFVNFSLSLALAMWALGLWMRSLGTGHVRYKAGFVSLAVIMMLVHPVPLLVVLVLSFLALAVSILRARRRNPSQRPAGLLLDLGAYGLAASTVLYIRLFTNKQVLEQSEPGRFHGAALVLHRFRTLIDEDTLSAFYGHTAGLRAYRLSLGVLVVVAFMLALVAFLRRRKTVLSPNASLWFGFAILIWVVFPFLPGDLNGSHYFADRLVWLAWIAPLLAASAFTVPKPAVRYAIVIAALLMNGGTLLLAESYMRPAALEIAHLNQVVPELNGKIGLLLGNQGIDLNPPGLNYNPYFWSAAHFFRANDAIFENTPWLDLAIIPIGCREAPICRIMSGPELESAELVTQRLQNSTDARTQILSSTDFILVRTPLADLEPTASGVMLLDQRSTWHCAAILHAALQVCLPTPKLPSSPPQGPGPYSPTLPVH